MLKKVFGTIGIRYFVAILNFVLIFVNANVLGRDGLGQIAMVLASANIGIACSSILTGSSIVYYLKENPLTLILLPAYAWAIIGSFLTTLVLTLLGVASWSHFLSIFLISVLISLVNANTRFLLGLNRIFQFNMINAIQGFLFFFVLLLCYFVLGHKEVDDYLGATIFSQSIVFFLSFYLLRSHLKTEDWKRIPILLRKMLTFGLWGGLDNLAEQLTIRANYFLLYRYGGFGNVGLFEPGNKISESVWHVSRSVSAIEYNEIAEVQEEERQIAVYLRLLLLTLAIVIPIVGVLICIPEYVFTDLLFSEKFQGISSIILLLSPGIIAFAAHTITGHYFIGSGKIKYSAYASVFGLIVLLLVGIIIIPGHGVEGAAMTASITYIMMFIFSFTLFKIKSKRTFKALYIIARYDKKRLKD